MKKILVIISIILFVLIAALEIYVQSDAFALKIRPYVVEPLREVLGPDVEIGRVGANFIPLYLEVRDLSLIDARAQQAAAVRKVRIYINPAALLLKEIRLSLITILEPRLYAERARDGALNITPLMERIKSNITRRQSAGPSRYSLILRGITIRNGRIEFKDDMTSAQLSVIDLNMTAKVDLSRGRAATTIKSSRIRISAPAYPELPGSLTAAFEYNQGRLRIDSVEFSTADAAVQVSGTAGPLPEVPLNLKLKVSSGPKALGRFIDILRPVKKQQPSRIEASALIGGNMTEPVIDGHVGLSTLSFHGIMLQDGSLSFAYRNGNLSIKGEKWKLAKGDKGIAIDSIDGTFGYRNGVLDIKRFDVRADDLSLHLEGRADPSTGFDAFLSAESSERGRALSFATTMPLEGNLIVKGHISGALISPRFDGTVSARAVSMRRIPFANVDGRLEYRDKRIKLSSVDIHEKSSHYIFDGSIDLSGKEPAYAARLKVIRSDVVNIVALFYEQLPLRLSAVGELSFNGTARNYSGSGYLKLDAGSAYGESFTRGAITASLTTGKIAFPQVVLYKERGMVKANGWIRFDGAYSADLESRDIDLSAVDHLAALPLGGESKLDIHSSGSFSHPRVKASLHVDALSYRHIPVGGLRAQMEIEDSLLTVAAGLSDELVQLSVRWTLKKPYPWTASAKVRAEGIDPFLLFGNKGLSDRVKLIADGRMTARGAGMNLSSLFGEAVFQRLSLVVGDYRIDNESDAGFTLDAGRLAVTSLNFTGPGTKIAMSGWARLMAEVDLTFRGTANLSLLKLMYREVEHAAGTVEMKLTVKDDWNNPDVAGELRIQNGEVKIKDIPQRFSALNGRIAFTQGKIVTDSLAGEMGGGTLGVSGWVQLSGFALQNFSAKATVENVTVRYPEGLVSTLSGDLYYDGDASDQSLTGDITIKRARYDKRIEWKSMLVDIGRGLYHKKKTDVGWIGDTQINVRFHGAESILFQNNLAKMPLDVDVFLRGTVNDPQLLGRIEARKGVVYFRKNEFKILHASADFIDPGRMNPVLDIQAETRIREYLIRLAVTGTAEHAVVTFISDPSLIDTDILSILALGKTGLELKGKETGVGVGEAASFASGQFQDFIERQSRSLTGLDRFQIDPYVSKSDTSVPRVTVGKEVVQNKLYVTYSSNVGASAPEQLFRIEYLLNKHFSLLGGRDEMGSNGADIKYRFEFK